MIIGVTGSFGTGKTTVANLFGKHGFEVINADELYHGIYEKDKALRNKIFREFGTLDRSKIKKIVFSDYKKLKRLNEITHPLIIQEIKKRAASIIKKQKDKNEKNKQIIANGDIRNKLMANIKNNETIKNKINKKMIDEKIEKSDAKIVLDVPLLIESNMQDMVDKIIVVKCDEKAQIQRLLKKKKYSEKDIRQIIKSQTPLKEKIKYADFVVDNSGAIEKTRKQVESIIENL